MDEEEFEISSRGIALDWKATVQDFVDVARVNCVELEFLNSESFEDLLAPIMGEIIGSSLREIAGALKLYNYLLVSFETQSDDYLFGIIQSKPEIKKLFKNESKLYKFEIVKPGKVKSSGAKKKMDYIVDSIDFESYFSLFHLLDGIKYGYFLDPESQSDTEYLFEIDLNFWPPRETKINLNGKPICKDDHFSFSGDKLLGKPLFVRSHWKKDKIIGLKIAGSDYWVLENHQLSKLNLEVAEGFDESTCIALKDVWFTIKSLKNPKLKKPLDMIFQIWKFSKDQHQLVFEFSQTCPKLLKISETQMLIIFGNEDLQYQVWDLEKESFLIDCPKTFPIQPDFLHSNTFVVLSSYELLYFFIRKQPHPEANEISEYFLSACRIHLITGEYRTCELNGIEGTQKLDMNVLKTDNKDPLLYRSIDSSMFIDCSHSDWMVFSMVGSSFGKKTLFWFWNRNNDEYFRIDNQDIRVGSMDVFYSHGLSCFLGVDGSIVHKLIDFELIKSSVTILKAQWSKNRSSQELL